MATQQAWDDFMATKTKLEHVIHALLETDLKYQLQTRIKEEIKIGILQDADRKAAMAAIANTHPTWPLAAIEVAVEKLLDLNEHLENEGFYD